MNFYCLGGTLKFQEKTLTKNPTMKAKNQEKNVTPVLRGHLSKRERLRDLFAPNRLTYKNHSEIIEVLKITFKQNRQLSSGMNFIHVPGKLPSPSQTWWQTSNIYRKTATIILDLE